MISNTNGQARYLLLIHFWRILILNYRERRI